MSSTNENGTPCSDDAQCCATTKSMLLGVVTVGERGQVVIPAEGRKEFEIAPGDKLLVVRHPFKPGLMLFKADVLESMMAEMVDELNHVRSHLASPETEASPGGTPTAPTNEG